MQYNGNSCVDKPASPLYEQSILLKMQKWGSENGSVKNKATLLQNISNSTWLPSYFMQSMNLISSRYDNGNQVVNFLAPYQGEAGWQLSLCPITEVQKISQAALPRRDRLFKL